MPQLSEAAAVASQVLMSAARVGLLQIAANGAGVIVKAGSRLSVMVMVLVVVASLLQRSVAVNVTVTIWLQLLTGGI